MKIQILIIVLLSGSLFCNAQSIERSVVASSGSFYENDDISLSWTIGEIATETFTNGSNIITQGFQQPGISMRIF